MAAGPRLIGKAETAAIFLSTACVVLLADLVTKSLAFSRLDPFTPCVVIPGCLNFSLSRNLGAVFGLGQGQRTYFILFTLVAAAGIVWAVAVHGRASRFFTFGLGCVLGGALGNLVDRLMTGEVRDFIDVNAGAWVKRILFDGAQGGVRDFIDVHAGARHWPTFNIADMAICTGAAILVLWAFRAPKEKGENVGR